MAIRDSAEDFLREFHRCHAGVTARAFAHGRTEHGLSSYELLGAVIPEDRIRQATAMDLGCGDGYLLERLIQRGLQTERAIGIDMSPDELALARARLPSTTQLICARAQKLPVDTASVDYVLSHLAFMLMDEIESVIAELARVLRPGGQFATVLGGGPRTGDTFEQFIELLIEIERELGITPVAIGDRRMYQNDGLCGLLCPESGFHGLELHDFYLDIGGPLEQVWGSVASAYPVFSLPAEATLRLRERFIEAVRPRLRPNGTLPCSMFIRLATCVRAAG